MPRPMRIGKPPGENRNPTTEILAFILGEKTCSVTQIRTALGWDRTMIYRVLKYLYLEGFLEPEEGLKKLLSDLP